MRLINFRIPAAIVGFVPATIVGFALIASATIEPALAADAMELRSNEPGDLSVFSDKDFLVAGFNNGGVNQLRPKSDNTASFARITKGNWKFCDLANLQGECITLGPGDHILATLRFNDKITSFKRIR